LVDPGSTLIHVGAYVDLGSTLIHVAAYVDPGSTLIHVGAYDPVTQCTLFSNLLSSMVVGLLEQFDSKR